MGINFDDFWILGSVRTRATAPDPFAGLRGRAYIAARKLDKPIEKIVSQVVAEVKSQSSENLIKAINQRTAIADRGQKFLLASGSMDYQPGESDRRWFPLRGKRPPAQARGTPELAVSLLRLRDLADYEQADLARMKILTSAMCTKPAEEQ